MADFFTRLWESVFVPGPTPTLLIATNASFAALELVLLVLLAATYSVHFLVLSILSGALWWAINWFAAELLEVQRAEQEAEKQLEARMPRGVPPPETSTRRDSSTEEEGVATAVDESQDLKRRKPVIKDRPVPKDVTPAVEKLQPSRASIGEGLSEMSGTEDEWEKVSGSGLLEK